MGAGASKSSLTQKQVHRLVKETGFAPSELDYLHRRFRSLCKSGDTLSRSDIMANPHLRDNVYVTRLYGITPKDELGEVTFEAFVGTAAVFRPGKDINEKLRFIFNMFDFNMDDSLGPQELDEMIKVIRPELVDEERKALVKQTTADILAKVGDTYKDGQIHSKSFIAYTKTLPGIDALLTLNLADELELKLD
jgi:Ca2+-binding EF-hand superfamily protein